MSGGFILRQFFDVSLLITEEMVVYPGKPSPSIQRYASIPRDNVNESILTLGSHTGTHVESRLHLQDGKESVADLPLDHFYGKCKVFDLIHVENEIHSQDLETFDIQPGDIVLLKTRNSTWDMLSSLRTMCTLKWTQLNTSSMPELKPSALTTERKPDGDDEVREILINNTTLF